MKRKSLDFHTRCAAAHPAHALTLPASTASDGLTSKLSPSSTVRTRSLEASTDRRSEEVLPKSYSDSDEAHSTSSRMKRQ